MRVPMLALLLVLPIAASAQPPAAAPVVRVELSSFDFDPMIIRLRAGQPVVLRLVNRGDRSHNFSAPLFFTNAAGVSGPVRNGKVEVRGGQSVDVRLTPRRGNYRLTCAHTFHSSLGMEGDIVVQ
jgi:plastocyanin